MSESTARDHSDDYRAMSELQFEQELIDFLQLIGGTKQWWRSW